MFAWFAAMRLTQTRSGLKKLQTQHSKAKLSPVGVKTLTEFSVLRNNVELTQYLSPAPAVVNVHKKCRLRYTSP